MFSLPYFSSKLPQILKIPQVYVAKSKAGDREVICLLKNGLSGAINDAVYRDRCRRSGRIVPIVSIWSQLMPPLQNDNESIERRRKLQLEEKEKNGRQDQD